MPSLYVVFSGNLQTQAGGAGPPTHTEYILEPFESSSECCYDQQGGLFPGASSIMYVDDNAE